MIPVIKPQTLKFTVILKKNSKNESEPRPFLIIIHRLFNSLQLKVGISMRLNPEIDKE